MAPTKLQRTTLAQLRTILRHVRERFDAVAPAPSAAAGAPSSSSPDAASSSPRGDVSLFTRHVLDEFRRGAAETDKAKARALRAYAADVTSYLQAVRDQQVLLAELRGADPDAPAQRRATARFVGLDMPKVPGAGPNGEPGGVPLGRPVEAVRADYEAKLRGLGIGTGVGTGAGAGAGAGGAAFSSPSSSPSPYLGKLKGVDNLKAQLYGIEAVLQQKREAAAGRSGDVAGTPGILPPGRATAGTTGTTPKPSS
jgi:hypothetical protein